MAEGSFLSRLGQSITGSSRMLIVVGGAGALAGLVWFFGRGEPPVAPSQLPAPGLNQPTVQGRDPVTPAMRDQLSVADQRRLDTAQQGGGSALPTLVIDPQNQAGLPNERRGAPVDPAPLPRPDPPVAERPVLIPPTPAPVAPVPVQVAQANQGDDNLVELMKRQMENIARLQYPPASVTFLQQTPPAAIDRAASQAQAAPEVPRAQTGVVDPTTGLRLPLPGTILYAELVGEANSDAPGPVLARILQGDLAGATLIGSFTTGREALVLQFTSLSLERTREGVEVNRTVPVSAVAVDSRTVGTALATSVDYHLLRNVGFTFAAAFAQGFGQAIAQSGQTIVQNPIGGITVTNPQLDTRRQLYVAGGQAAAATGQQLNQLFGNRPPTIRVAAGTPVGILFLPGQQQQ